MRHDKTIFLLALALLADSNTLAGDGRDMHIAARYA